MPSKNAKAFNIGDITNAALKALIGTKCLTWATLAIGTTTTKIRTVASAITYTLDGKMFQKTGADDLFDTTSASVVFNKVALTANQFTVFVCGFDGSGNPYVLQGTVSSVSQADVAFPELVLDSNGITSFVKPDGTLVNFCPIGYVKVASGASAFTIGTTALTGVATYVNCSVLPATM